MTTITNSTLILDAYRTYDEFNVPYFIYNVTNLRNSSRPFDHTAHGFNYATFLAETLPVRPRLISIWTSDLTNRDDIILAILSLALLLIIDSLISTVLLRTYNNNISNFGFSVKHFLDLARDFRLRNLIRGRRSSNSKSSKRPINYRLLLIASLTLIVTFGVEVAILYFSSPVFIDITNRLSAFTYEETILPHYPAIREKAGSAANRPCTSITLVDVNDRSTIDQGQTRITPCMTSTGDLNATEGFKRVTDETTLTFSTNTHEFGAEHSLQIGEHKANFRMIIYFNLQDSRRKLLRKRSQFFSQPEATYFIHQQFVAFLFNEYVNKTGDTSMSLSRLQSLKYEQTVQDGPVIIITQINRQERFRKSLSTKHTTVVRGILPRGPPALRYAIAYLKGASGLSIKGPDLNDMDIGSSSTWAQERRMWREEMRRLNWLTLTIVVISSSVLLIILRLLLRPIGTAEIANTYVTRQVGAEIGRPVSTLGPDEKTSFALQEWHLSYSSSSSYTTP